MSNPLMMYAAPDQCYVRLVGSIFYKDTLQPDADPNEISIKPMAARDEYLFNNPSALMNGKALEGVLKNCVPEVKNVLDLCINDVEILLLGIYQASGHKTYDVPVTCPNCNKKGEVQRDIEQCLDEVQNIDNYSEFVLKSGLVLNIKPNTLKSTNDVAKKAFEQQKLALNLKNGAYEDLTDEEKMEIFTNSINTMVELNFKIINDSVHSIKTPDGSIVTNKDHIIEFLETLNKEEVQEIKDRTEIINSLGVIKKIETECSECSHVWEEDVPRFDPSYFFD